jgi:hypothetical protein
MWLRGLLAGFVFAAACSRDVATTAAPPDAAAGTGALADRAADQPSGVLSLCKQAGAGLSAGQLRDAQHRCRRRDRLGHRAVDDDGDVHE